MNDFTDVETMHRALGEFWYSVYDGEAQVHNYLNSIVEAYKQIDIDIEELLGSLSRQDIAVFRRRLRMPLEVRLSDFEDWVKDSYVHNGMLDHTGVFAYDSSGFTDIMRVRLPDNIVAVGSVGNGIEDATVEWFDPELTDHFLYLPDNPFDCDFKQENVYDEYGVIVDKKITLWLKDVRIDRDDLWKTYGYTLGVRLPSSDRYKQIINALFDANIAGASEKCFFDLLTAITGTTAYTVIDETTTEQEFPGLVLDKNLVLTTKTDYLIAPNKDIPVVLDDSVTPVRYDLPLMGDPDTVKEFNDTVYKNGVARNTEVTNECELEELRKLNITSEEHTATPVEEVDSAGFADIHRVIFGR